MQSKNKKHIYTEQNYKHNTCFCPHFSWAELKDPRLFLSNRVHKSVYMCQWALLLSRDNPSTSQVWHIKMLIVITDLSVQMLTFNGVWLFGEVFSSRMNPGFHCTGQMADVIYEERCSLHGWIPVFTVQGRWQTSCMASCGWAVCWCQRCGSSGPWWRWGYGMGRHMLSAVLGKVTFKSNALQYCVTL